MLYYYLRFFNYLLTVFGLKKPFILKSENVSNVTVLDRLWTLFIIAIIVLWYFYVLQNPVSSDTQNNLVLICETNEFIVCSLAIVAYIIQTKSVYKRLYETINRSIKHFKVKEQDVWKFCLKLYLLGLITLIKFSAITLWAFFSKNRPHLILVKFPLILENLHLLLHICIILALLKSLNEKLNTTLYLKNNTFIKVGIKSYKNLFSYLFEPEMNFISNNVPGEHFETKYFCYIYHDLCCSIKLLEKQHGLQILLEIWMIFVSGVIHFTIIASEKMAFPFLTVLRLVAPLIWYTTLGFLDDQLRQEVELTEILIMKHLIDFRCDKVSRFHLTTFKQLVSTNRLRFKACGLLPINYAMVLGTVVSVVTYSIIMIQLFMDK